MKSNLLKKDDMPVNGVYVRKLPNQFVMEFDSTCGYLELSRNGVIFEVALISGRVGITLYNKLVKRSEEIVAEECQKAALIGKDLSKWILIQLGSFPLCTNRQKGIKHHYLTTKVIYQFNLSKFNINI